MEHIFDFDEIRPYRDNEVHDVLMRLVKEPALMANLPAVFPSIPMDEIIKKIETIHTVQDLQVQIMSLFLKGVEEQTTLGIELKGTENISKNKAYLYISNHRDIILDSAFLNHKLLSFKALLTEIAIGDNLLIFPWIKDLVRVNRNFIVQRDAPIRQMLDISKRLSAYMRHTLTERNQSIWIAQREGRAKNSDDRTQEALLKMMSMSGKQSVALNLKDLHICPLSISYEYDPCDYLKAIEFQQKRDNPEHKKDPKDDLLNMGTGIKGFKGRVVYYTNGDINKELEHIDQQTSSKNEQLELCAQLIDKCIHLHYEIFPGNKVAYDLLLNTNKFASEYDLKEKATFETYLQQQLDKITIPNKDNTFLRKKILEMYANPLINKLKAENKL
jgi:hypothetical protein